MERTNNAIINYQEVPAKVSSGMGALVLNTLCILASIGVFIFSIVLLGAENGALGGILLTVSLLYSCLVGPLLYKGIKVVRPNEALVLTLFGRYVGTLRTPGLYFVNPFCTAVNPPDPDHSASVVVTGSSANAAQQAAQINTMLRRRPISLKTMTLDNEKQKINDQLGNPIIIGIVVIWRVVDTAKAVFCVDNYKQFISIQCDSALRDIVRMYPYDLPDDESDHNERSLRGSSQEIALRLKELIQEKVEIAGLAIEEARITHLSYAPEIAAAMLQRQQASAIIDARKLIVEGAVGMVEMALDKLSMNDVVHLDEERKAAMVSNLLVVLCGSKEAQPIVNSGSLY